MTKIGAPIFSPRWLTAVVRLGMSLWLLLARALSRVIARRRRQGPLRPSWSLAGEATQELMRQHLALLKTRPVAEVRALQNQLGRLLPSQSQRRTLRRADRLG